MLSLATQPNTAPIRDPGGTTEGMARKIVFFDDSGDENEDGDNDDEEYQMESAPQPRVSLSHTNGGKRRKSSTLRAPRRRRRSSARFLKLGGVPETSEVTQSSLSEIPNIGEVYKQAIAMSAQNRINSSNSWGLHLIDILDHVIANPEEDTHTATPPNSQASVVSTQSTTISSSNSAGINFTRASCTLDASVKIYSYRVDDVHLTSYKVLANLNRTETNKKSKSTGPDEDDVGDAGSGMEEEQQPCRKRAKRNGTKSTTDTIEHNVNNINLTKLDSAYDIDPLFHKMSKTFDEGGAKGLLLANLGVSSKGCNIVFDSTLDQIAEIEAAEEEKQDGNSGIQLPDMVDISTLTAKLDSVLGGQTVNSLSLVPQLATLREEYSQLESEGFVEKVVTSARYASTPEEEIEADRSIHIEAIERSRASIGFGNKSFGLESIGEAMTSSGTNDDEDHEDDTGPIIFDTNDLGGDDFVDVHDDAPINDSFAPIADSPVNANVVEDTLTDSDNRFSSTSFQETVESVQPPSQATVLLDAIAAGTIAGSQSDYEYFNKSALQNIQGNAWAGSAHWKKTQSTRTRNKPKKLIEEIEGASPSPVKKRARRKAGKKSQRVLVDLQKAPDNEKMDELLKEPPRKTKRSADPLQMSDAIKTKCAKNDNLLPLDAGIGIDGEDTSSLKLTSLFLRPESSASDLSGPSTTDASKSSKTVGFGGVETVTWGATGADVYDDHDNDGIGFDFGGASNDDYEPSGRDDFIVKDLEGIRKVDKVNVGYATIAKKVDVKRLKRDLWLELEEKLDDSPEPPTDEEEEEEEMDESTKPPLSFKKTVEDMQTSQSQPDVTLPFYFICVLHLANEKGLELESSGLEDFVIRGG